MNSFLYLLSVGGAAVLASSAGFAQSVQGGSVTGGSATGGSATGGSVVGGSVTGGAVTGGSATGGSATGGSATAGSVTSGTATQGMGTATATVNGRQVRVSAPGSVSVNVNGASANVSVAGKTLTVGDDKLTLDGKNIGDIPAETKNLDVRVENGTLSVQGDGKELARKKVGGS